MVLWDMELSLAPLWADKLCIKDAVLEKIEAFRTGKKNWLIIIFVSF